MWLKSRASWKETRAYEEFTASSDGRLLHLHEEKQGGIRTIEFV